jgi:hypothetical protein
VRHDSTYGNFLSMRRLKNLSTVPEKIMSMSILKLEYRLYWISDHEYEYMYYE